MLANKHLMSVWPELMYYRAFLVCLHDLLVLHHEEICFETSAPKPTSMPWMCLHMWVQNKHVCLHLDPENSHKNNSTVMNAICCRDASPDFLGICFARTWSFPDPCPRSLTRGANICALDKWAVAQGWRHKSKETMIDEHATDLKEELAWMHSGHARTDPLPGLRPQALCTT